jgi:diaminohydroxyphosphoribosylaminopyrimidine deaminase / 5-amino-6-(5-phosphoribosylamino)uracil reductase
VVSTALRSGVVDKVVIFYAPRFLGGDALAVLPAWPRRPRGRRAGRARLRLPVLQEVTLRRFGPDFAVEGYLRDVYGNR